MEPRGEELDQVEEDRVCPVDVLEDERGRLVSRPRFDEDAHRLEEAVAIGSGRFRLQAEQNRDVARDRLGFLLAEEPLHEGAQLPRRYIDVVAVEDSGELLHLHRECAVGTALAIRQAAPADYAPPASCDAFSELRREPRLPDSGRAENRDQVRAPLELDALPRRVE